MCHHIKNKAIKESKLISLKKKITFVSKESKNSPFQVPWRCFNGLWIGHYSELCVFLQFYALHANIRMSSVNVSYSWMMQPICVLLLGYVCVSLGLFFWFQTAVAVVLPQAVHQQQVENKDPPQHPNQAWHLLRLLSPVLIVNPLWANWN